MLEIINSYFDIGLDMVRVWSIEKKLLYIFVILQIMGDFDDMPALKSLDEDDFVIKVKEEPIEHQNEFEFGYHPDQDSTGYPAEKKFKMDPDLISSDAAETIKVEIDPEDAVIMHYQDDSSDDETNQYENNVFNVKEEILEEDRNNYIIKLPSGKESSFKVENHHQYENEISEDNTNSDSTNKDMVWKRVKCPECQREIHPHSLSRHLSDVHKYQSSIKPSTLGSYHLLLL